MSKASLRRVSVVRYAAALASAMLLFAVQGCGDKSADAGFGLSLRKPAGWTLLSASPVVAQGEELRYSSADLEQALITSKAAPLFALLKYAPPHAGVNPIFGMNLERDPSLAGQAPMALLEARVMQAHATGQFEVVQAVAARSVAGVPAAQAEMRGVGKDEMTRVLLALVLVDDTSVLMAASDAQSGTEAARVEFDQVLHSLRFTRD